MVQQREVDIALQVRGEPGGEGCGFGCWRERVSVSRFADGDEGGLEGKGRRTGFSFAVEGGESCDGADEDAEVGDGDGERDPIDHFGRRGRLRWLRI